MAMSPLLRRPPEEMGVIHFAGIGGIGMSGIAQVLQAQGYTVQGSDITDNPLTQTMRANGVEIHVGHDASHLDGAALLVVSSAVTSDNPELVAARERKIPVLKRAEMLGEMMRNRRSIAVSGTHGKTTTTSLVATLMDLARFDPTVICGGIMNTYDSNVRVGSGEWVVVEADESDGTLVELPATVGIVTNIDNDHMDFFETPEALESCFHQFVDHLPPDGLGILCVDHPRVRALAHQFPHKNIATYGFSAEAQFRAHNVQFKSRGMGFDVDLPGGGRWEGLELSLFGEHNVENALPCVVLAIRLGIGEAAVRRAFRGFGGVKRRFTRTGLCQGVAVVDDYAHHPEEIRAVLKTAKKICRGRGVAVCQPHRYSRVSRLFDDFKACFRDADDVILLPIYAVGEPPSDVSSEDLAKVISGVSGIVEYISGFDGVVSFLNERLKEGDMVICLGAGSITHLAQRLPHELKLKA